MKGQAGFWDIEHRLAELSAEGDPLEPLSATVDFEIFRAVLAKAVRRSDPAKGGRLSAHIALDRTVPRRTAAANAKKSAVRAPMSSTPSPS